MTKRQREQKKRERQLEKAERKALRKASAGQPEEAEETESAPTENP